MTNVIKFEPKKQPDVESPIVNMFAHIVEEDPESLGVFYLKDGKIYTNFVYEDTLILLGALEVLKQDILNT